MKSNLQNVSGTEQLALLVSKRDRMVSIYNKGRELVATVTVSTNLDIDPDGGISIGLGYTPDRTLVYVEYLDEEVPCERMARYRMGADEMTTEFQLGIKYSANLIRDWMAMHNWDGREDAHKELTHIAAELDYAADGSEDDGDDA